MARHPSFKPNAVEIPDLYTLSLECLAAHPENIRCLHGVPEEVAISLFDRIVGKGKLTPRLLQLFEDAEQEAVLHRVKQLGISKWTPPLIKDSRGDYLGPKRRW